MANDATQPRTVILVIHDGMGKADTELQHKLIVKYFQLLFEDGKLPGVVCFYTDGVKLVCDGSPVLDQLRTLEEKGVPLIVCNTCLNHFNLADKRQVGIDGGMGDIIEAQWKADKVITI